MKSLCSFLGFIPSLKFNPVLHLAAPILLVGGVISSNAQTKYQATDLGNGMTSYAINDSGTVVGSMTMSNGNADAFSYSNGQLTDISATLLHAQGLNGTTYAYAINNLGVIV